MRFVRGLLVFGFCWLPWPHGHQDSIVSLLDRYQNGQHHLVAAELAQVQNFSQWAEQVKQDSRAWTSAHGPSMAEPRRLVLGAFVLEAARPQRSTRRWADARSLIEWACQEIRQSKPGTPGERAWFLASVALIEEARDWPFLWKVPETLLTTEFGKRTLEEHGTNIEHLIHGKARFPQEPRLLLAEVVAREQDTWRLGILLRVPLGSGPIGDQLLPDDYSRYLNSLITPENSGASVRGFRESGRATEPRAELSRLAALVEAQQDYEELTEYESVRAEAWLRAGYGLLRLGKYQQALERFARVQASTPEPFLAYLAHYFSGWILQHSKRPDQAVAAYRRALATVPGAASSTKRLAALLFEMNQRTEAERLLAAATGVIIDPVSQFTLGDARSWPRLIDDLRARLK